MFKQYADETMEFVKLIEADGARLPGSDEEKKACKKIQAEMIARTGLTPKTEKFIFAPEASIGAINKLGWVVLATTLVYYIGGLGGAFASMLMYTGVLLFTIFQIVLYKGTFDGLCKQATADNIITELPPASGETKYTVYLGAHYDSSWCWKLAKKNPNTAIIKTVYGIVGVIVMLAISILRICYGFGLLWEHAEVWMIILYCVPMVCVPGFYFLTQYTSQDKTIASPGAMDNLSGIGINMMILKYFKEHPEDMPEGMRLVHLGFASEEAGLKGSDAFVKAHKNDGSLENAYLINVDSVADPDHFEAIKGDTWQGTHFDKKLINMSVEAMRESGVANPKIINNPVGGCDSTPFCRAGVPTFTFAAQNPTSTNYYHTTNDTSDRIDVSTFETGLNVVYKVIKKIATDREGK